MDDFCTVVGKLGRCWRLHRKSWPSVFQEAFATMLWEARLVIRPKSKITPNRITGDTGGTVINLFDVLGFNEEIAIKNTFVHVEETFGNEKMVRSSSTPLLLVSRAEKHEDFYIGDDISNDGHSSDSALEAGDFTCHDAYRFNGTADCTSDIGNIIADLHNCIAEKVLCISLAFARMDEQPHGDTHRSDIDDGLQPNKTDVGGSPCTSGIESTYMMLSDLQCSISINLQKLTQAAAFLKAREDDGDQCEDALECYYSLFDPAGIAERGYEDAASDDETRRNIATAIELVFLHDVVRASQILLHLPQEMQSEARKVFTALHADTERAVSCPLDFYRSPCGCEIWSDGLAFESYDLFSKMADVIFEQEVVDGPTFHVCELFDVYERSWLDQNED